MKKCIVFLIAVGLVLYGASPLFAGGVDNKHNWSAEYIRTLNRNAATDSADIVAYNPAGTVKMENGFYGNLSVHYIDKEYTNTLNGTDYDSQEPSFIPGLFMAYKKDRWSIYGAFTITGGGGYVDFSQGNATTNAAGVGIIAGANAKLDLAQAGGLLPAPLTAAGLYYNQITSQRLEAESYYKAYTIGAAYKINDILSISLGTRFSDAYKEAQGTIVTSAATSTFGTVPGVNPDVTAVVDYEQEADGWCAIIGANISPSEALNIGIRYESTTHLDFESTVNQDTVGILPGLGVNNGKSTRRDLPALLGFGLSYKFTPKIRVETNYIHYLQKDANWNGAENNVSDGYDLGIVLEYTFNEKLKGSLGYLYTETGIEAKYMLPEAPELDANTLGGGIAYEFKPGLIFTFALGNAFYDNASFISATTGANVEYSKNNFFLGFGVQYKFF